LGVPVRGLYLEGEPWFVGRDIAGVLEYSNQRDALYRHCRGVAKRYPIVDTLGGTQEVRIISEIDVYRLVSNSTMPKAREFGMRIDETVIPEIRKTGDYQTGRKPADGVSHIAVAPEGTPVGGKVSLNSEEAAMGYTAEEFKKIKEAGT
jgi:prophage antirepressor-like protein